MNLHALVRGGITSVNQDRPILYLPSAGFSVNASGKQIPAYLTPVPLIGQIQPIASDDLEHTNYLNKQGIYRAVYMFGNTEGIVRPLQQGGDLLQFAQFQGQAVANWLTIKADETWNVDQGGWCRVVVVLQTDSPS